MSPPRQDVLAFEGLLGNTKYEAVPAGQADEVVAHHKRRARKFVFYRLVGVLLVGIILTAVSFRFVRDLTLSGVIGSLFVLVVGGLQLRALDQGVPEVVARDIEPGEVRLEYGVDPAEGNEKGS